VGRRRRDRVQKLRSARLRSLERREKMARLSDLRTQLSDLLGSIDTETTSKTTVTAIIEVARMSTLLEMLFEQGVIDRVDFEIDAIVKSLHKLEPFRKATQRQEAVAL
jgi:hypothetical protein